MMVYESPTDEKWERELLDSWLETEERFFFMPNDPTLTTKLNVEFNLIKGVSGGSELQKLHKHLVIGGILSEAECWATRKMAVPFYRLNSYRN
ncbi:hypothetical protein BC332_30323 [Capsicum chinense]|nr:hypothetical protein BC332_30323 [Capsicum chinense]